MNVEKVNDEGLITDLALLVSVTDNLSNRNKMKISSLPRCTGPSTVRKPIRTVKHFPHLITLHFSSWAYSTPPVPSFDSKIKRQTTSELQRQIMRRLHKIVKCNLQCDTSFNRKFPETKLQNFSFRLAALQDPCAHYVGWQLRRSAATVHVNNFLPYKQWTVELDSSVGTATRYALDGPGIGSWSGRDFSHPSAAALGPTQTPVWVPDTLTGVKRPRSGVYHPPPLAPRLKKSTAIPVLHSGPSW
jgi:hypothetical protein